MWSGVISNIINYLYNQGDLECVKNRQIFFGCKDCKFWQNIMFVKSTSYIGFSVKCDEISETGWLQVLFCNEFLNEYAANKLNVHVFEVQAVEGSDWRCIVTESTERLLL